MIANSALPLAKIEYRLRALLPADLYASVWIDPSSEHLMQVFQHLRTLQHILHDYVPRQVSDMLPQPGDIHHSWHEGTLLFTDLAGFTTLMEAMAQGQQGATTLLTVLNQYFSDMIEIISKSGGDLLEFTGDAMLVQFLDDRQQHNINQAVRTGLRMQRAMANFDQIQTERGSFSLRMRVGIHTGRFVTADIGTPMRMAHVLLGNTVQCAKQAEGAGMVGRVCLTSEAIAQLMEQAQNPFTVDPPHSADYALVRDDFSDDELGEYDISLRRRRPSSSVLLDRSADGLLDEIDKALDRVELLSSYLPVPILHLLVESASKRQIPPQFAEAVVMFVNLSGLPEAVDQATPDEVDAITATFTKAFALINATVRSRCGILQKVTYHLVGSDILIYFGVLNAHTDDAMRAAETALIIRDRILPSLGELIVGGQAVALNLHIGMSCGAVFAAEIGEMRGRREFNILGDTVNTASRITSHAQHNQILVSQSLYHQLKCRFACDSLGDVTLKGKSRPAALYALKGDRADG
jgi:adenylate cyclase